MDPRTLLLRRWLPVVALAAALVAGCGRSAPESAAPEGESGGAAVDTDRAGIRVVSDDPVVAAGPTTAPPPTSTPPTTAPAGDATTYEVQPGDTLSAIADRFGVTIDAISEANGLTNVNAIQPGQELIIPAPG